jgi:hypothetical protein
MSLDILCSDMNIEKDADMEGLRTVRKRELRGSPYIRTG